MSPNRQGWIYRAVLFGTATLFLRHRTGRPVDRVPADSALVIASALVPVAVRTAVAALAEHRGISFGAFDVLADDAGRAFVIDFNSTPYWGGGELGELQRLVGPSH